MKKSIGVRTAVHPHPVFIICTYDAKGVPNAANIAWGGIASSGPDSISIAVRPSRYTYENLMSKKCFTVNLTPEKYMSEADYFGIVSGRDVNKFEVTGLTPVKAEFVDAPYIEEFPLIAECVVTHTLDLNAHTLFVGEIKDVKVDEQYADDIKGIAVAAGLLEFDSFGYLYRRPGEIAGSAFQVGRKWLENTEK